MTFVSLEFLIFLPLTLLVFFASPFRCKWLALLLASYIFYMAWNPPYIILIVGTTAVTWIAALKVGNGTHRSIWFWLGMLANLTPLIIFKYLNFMDAQVGNFALLLGSSWSPPVLQLLLPIAISFHSFQLMAYMIDVYKQRVEPEADWRVFFLYGCFFPQLVAGPIERGAHFLPQLRRLFDPSAASEFAISYDRCVDGLRLMLLGYFKKVVVADNLGPFVDGTFATHSTHSGLLMLVSAVAFALQIYFDFSAYTDIARGTARIMGFYLLENFNYPYLARSIQDFWRRWHISLTSWFRDYVYIPLGGNRVAPLTWTRNVLAAFVLSGLWHGANWTFVLWGLLHATYYLIEEFGRRLIGEERVRSIIARAPQLAGFIGGIVTFICVTLAWVVFRAPSIGDAVAILGQIARAVVDNSGFSEIDRATMQSFYNLPAAFLFAAILLCCEALAIRGLRFANFSGVLRWTVYYGVLVSMLVFGQFGHSPFIYFQF